MSMQHVNIISNRLSLRQPQRDSLEILARVCEIATLEKNGDTEKTLEIINSEFPTVENFERDFPSLCFALATGVGKTRLMGAFISYLFMSEGIRHYFVLAPNLTIYNKLITDFTPNTPKYVFQGISEFAVNQPMIITGDDYESGKGVREGRLFETNEIHINIFNISKINSEVRGGRSPRIKRLSEYIGQSYFDYLAELDDLVMLMDESHRYRASAGIRAINELQPILGLELTATPQVERGQKTIPFENVIYSYPLSCAMDDGFVKEPAVATRENFSRENYSDEGLEQLKLEDGVRIHENTKVELETYAYNNDKAFVKPFMLVVAQDTTHANALQEVIESDGFFDGRYKGKVITVHSNVRGEEKDEVIQQLLTVEDTENPVEIVIHVNMLKEGWDVTNLYTIVPLRAANSRTLVEQSIGRGLRLPYGKRVGIPSVDRLTIVSHDRFQEIVDHAKDPDSIIRTGVIIGKDIPEAGKKSVLVETEFERTIASSQTDDGDSESDKQKGLFDSPEEVHIAKATAQVIQQFETLRGSDRLLDDEVQEEIFKKVDEAVKPTLALTYIEMGKEKVKKIIRETTEIYHEMTIDIPKIVVVPEGDVVAEYEDFDLDTSNINLQPVDQQILIQHLHNLDERFKLRDGTGIIKEKRPEDYLIRGLVDYDDICYDDHSTLLYKLAGQVVERLRSYLSDEEEVLNVLQYNQPQLASLIHSQMLPHFLEKASSFKAHVTKGFITIRSNNFTAGKDENVRDFRNAVQEGERLQIRNMLFGGFKRCLFPIQKFDSDPERCFSVILEQDDDVIKWFKPSRKEVHIDYSPTESYEPDFIVETKSNKHVVEAKRASDMADPDVIKKADAAAKWCEYASLHSLDYDDKPWSYLLIPHDQISEQMTLKGLASKFTYNTD